MPSTYVTIGRDVLARRMEREQWDAFKYATTEAVAYHTGGPIVTTAEGTGQWEGGFEGAYVVVAGSAPRDADAFERILAAIAQRFGQEAIAYAVADVRFVG